MNIARRELLAALAGAAAWPIVARGQQGIQWKQVGVVAGSAEAEFGPALAAFRDRLKELGWSEGSNLSIDLRLSRGDFKRLTDEVGLLIDRRPDVIVAQGTPGLNAVREHSRAVPVVFLNVADPVRMGLIESLARPGGHATGFTNFEFTIGGKWLELLKELSPRVVHITLLVNPINPTAEQFAKFVETIGRSTGCEVVTAYVRNATDIALAITAAGQRSGGGVIVFPDSLPNLHRELIIGLVAHYRLPAIYPFREFPVEGGLISYGVDIADVYRQAAGYVDRILRGAKPADLPVQAPNKFDLVINLKTAKALGIEVPQTLLAAADAVIE